MLALTVIIIAVIALCIVLAVSASPNGLEERRWLTSVSTTHGLPLTVNDDRHVIGFDRKSQRIGVFDRTGTGYLFGTSHLAAVELTPVYQTVTESSGETRTNRGSQLVSAGIGAAVAGPAGAVIGGLSGSTRTSTTGSLEQRLASVELHVRFLAEDMPYVLIATSRIDAARELAARLANIIDVREPRSDRLEPPERVTTTLLNDEALKALPAPQQRRGWWSRTFGA